MTPLSFLLSGIISALVIGTGAAHADAMLHDIQKGLTKTFKDTEGI